MAQPILMPKMNQSADDCTIVKWRKQAGEVVKKGEILFEIETEKAVLEIESFFEGTLLKIITGEGTPVPVRSLKASTLKIVYPARGADGDWTAVAIPLGPKVAPAPSLIARLRQPEQGTSKAKAISNAACLLMSCPFMSETEPRPAI